jgi:hypothetical protein
VSTRAPEAPAKGTGMVLLTLAAGQFLMTLDSSVMNVSIATVAKDVGTTVTGWTATYQLLRPYPNQHQRVVDRRNAPPAD